MTRSCQLTRRTFAKPTPRTKFPAGIPVARIQSIPAPNHAPLRAAGIALRARASPAPAELREPRFPLDLSGKQLLAATTVGSPWLQNFNPKAFSVGQALKKQLQSEALNGCNLS